jgi:predicted O-methyltransferase YrrM
MPLSEAVERGLTLRGLPGEYVTAWVEARRPGLRPALELARLLVPFSKREVWSHEAAVLYHLALEYVGPRGTEGEILEIGTALGYSAALMALAAPEAHLVTLNPKALEYAAAESNLAYLPRIEVRQARSVEYLSAYAGPSLDLIFVDGSHVLEDVRVDCGWWRWVRPGGLMLFHDWSPATSARPTPGAYQAINEQAERLGRPFDVWVVDDREVGLVGWVKEASDG